MKRRVESFKTFTRKLGKGMHIEWQETKEIPSLLLKGQYAKAGAQVIDICKMAGLSIIWVIPGGAVITAMIVKFSHRARPSAFQKQYLRYPSQPHQHHHTQKPACKTGEDSTEDDA